MNMCGIQIIIVISIVKINENKIILFTLIKTKGKCGHAQIKRWKLKVVKVNTLFKRLTVN